MDTFVPFMIDGTLEVVLFDDMDGRAISIVDVIISEGPHMMEKIP